MIHVIYSVCTGLIRRNTSFVFLRVSTRIHKRRNRSHTNTRQEQHHKRPHEERTPLTEQEYVKRSTRHTHTTAEHTTAEQTTQTNTERATAQRRLLGIRIQRVGLGDLARVRLEQRRCVGNERLVVCLSRVVEVCRGEQRERRLGVEAERL